jgi:hypothetical protein
MTYDFCRQTKGSEFVSGFGRVHETYCQIFSFAWVSLALLA